MKTAATVEKYIRYTLGTILLMVAVNAFGGGCYGISGAKSVPVDWLKGTPFHSYLIPGIILFSVVGGACLVAATLVFIKHRLATLFSFYAAVIILIWIVTQLAMIGYVSWLQPLIVVIGIVIFFLTWLLRKYE